MNNFREVNNDIIKDWLEFREETAFCNMTPQDKKYCIYFDELAEKILNNVPKQNKKYVQKQLDQLDKNFMDYLCYWNEKYYRNGFVDGSHLVMGCLEHIYFLWYNIQRTLCVGILPLRNWTSVEVGYHSIRLAHTLAR